MEIHAADLQIGVEQADGGVLLTVVDAARLSLLLPSATAVALLDAIDRCMKTGERRSGTVDVWRAAGTQPLYGVHIGIAGASWTCGNMDGLTMEALADGLEALLD